MKNAHTGAELYGRGVITIRLKIRQSKMLFHLLNSILHSAQWGALHPEVPAALDGLIQALVEAFQGLVAGGFGLFYIRCAVDEVVESLMIRAVAVILDDVGGIFEQKDNAGGVSEPFCLFKGQMAVTENLLVLRKPHQIQQHKIKLFPCVVQKPLPVFLHCPAEKLIRIGKLPVHGRLKIRVRDTEMTVKMLIHIIDRQMIPLRQRPGYGGFATAGITGDEIHVFQIFFDDMILKMHNTLLLIENRFRVRGST